MRSLVISHAEELTERSRAHEALQRWSAKVGLFERTVRKAATPNGPIEQRWPLLAGLGCLSGFLSGLVGIGGGLIIVPALVLALSLIGVEGEPSYRRS